VAAQQPDHLLEKKSYDLPDLTAYKEFRMRNWLHKPTYLAAFPGDESFQSLV
jgi:hypothetical protein